jgi:lipid II:glycine glycyltransferase (peptidoglycan interpeptide bridge formation enzyme)
MASEFELMIDNFEEEDWRRYAADFADYSIYQTWSYQQVRAEMGGQLVSRAVIKDEDGIVSTMCHLRIKHVGVLGLRIGYVQWGPLFRVKDGTLRCTERVLRKLIQAYLGTKVNVLRIIPNVWNDLVGKELTNTLQNAGFRPVPNVAPYRTMVFPVNISEKEMRGRLHRSWRRGLRKAERAGLEIRQGPDIKYFNVLEQLYQAAIERKRFKGLNPREFIQPQHMLSDCEKMNVVVAYLDGEPIAAHATSHLGDTAVGTLAASSEKGLQCEAAYLVWWTTFLAARSAGMEIYDLGGIDPEDNPNVYQYKKRMGTEEKYHIGAFEICTNPAVKILWHSAERTYNYIKGK